MRAIVSTLLVLLLVSCASDTSTDRSPVIRTQDEADAYNLTISSPREFVYCRQVEVTGTKLLRTICGTVAQHENEMLNRRQTAIDTLNSIPVNN